MALRPKSSKATCARATWSSRVRTSRARRGRRRATRSPRPRASAERRASAAAGLAAAVVNQREYSKRRQPPEQRSCVGGCHFAGNVRRVAASRRGVWVMQATFELDRQGQEAQTALLARAELAREELTHEDEARAVIRLEGVHKNYTQEHAEGTALSG